MGARALEKPSRKLDHENKENTRLSSNENADYKNVENDNQEQKQGVTVH